MQVHLVQLQLQLPCHVKKDAKVLPPFMVKSRSLTAELGGRMHTGADLAAVQGVQLAQHGLHGPQVDGVRGQVDQDPGVVRGQRHAHDGHRLRH